MKFSIFKVLKHTTWPSRKQRWKDFLSVIEYTAFYALIIFLFDKLLSTGIIELINHFKH